MQKEISNMEKEIAIVIPAYHEGENVRIIFEAIAAVFKNLPYQYRVFFVDDGSRDHTLSCIKMLKLQYPAHVHYISFSRNFGHQNALKAGIDIANADATITMDGDMQHPPTLIPELIKQWEAGNDIVYTIRRETNTNSYFKRKTSQLFYRLLNQLSSIELENGTADFRLMDKKVVEAIRKFEEYDIFWRGLVKWIGFQQTGIEYDPAERVAGVSKYTFKKMMELALKGITSFSTKPLTIAIYIGFFSSIFSILFIPYALISYYFGHAISGWASIIVTIAFFGGLQLMILGIIGVYLGKSFMQTKNRPHYIVKESSL